MKRSVQSVSRNIRDSRRPRPRLLPLTRLEKSAIQPGANRKEKRVTANAGIRLRPATIDDIPQLSIWDTDPDVIAATTDEADAELAFDGMDWDAEIRAQSNVFQYLIAELDGRPVGAMLVIDPHLEPTHDWGTIEANLRAIDIWIGHPRDRGCGYGSEMMRQAIDFCFADLPVTAIVIDPLASNGRAHAFYQRLGFVPIGRRMFGEDDCLVHRLTREAWQSRTLTTCA
jgi:aminoglycoside 6'-N-acetyltransferase